MIFVTLQLCAAVLVTVHGISEECNHYSYELSSINQKEEVVINGCEGSYNSRTNIGSSEKLVCHPVEENAILVYGWDSMEGSSSGQCDLDLPYTVSNLSDTFSSSYSNIQTVCESSKSTNCELIFIKELTSCGDPYNTGAGGTYTYHAYYDGQCVSGKTYSCLSDGSLSESVWLTDDECSGSADQGNTYEQTSCYSFTCSTPTTTKVYTTDTNKSDTRMVMMFWLLAVLVVYVL